MRREAWSATTWRDVRSKRKASSCVTAFETMLSNRSVTFTRLSGWLPMAETTTTCDKTPDARSGCYMNCVTATMQYHLISNSISYCASFTRTEGYTVSVNLTRAKRDTQSRVRQQLHVCYSVTMCRRLTCCCPSWAADVISSAAAVIRSAELTQVPPNFCTLQ